MRDMAHFVHAGCCLNLKHLWRQMNLDHIRRVAAFKFSVVKKLSPKFSSTDSAIKLNFQS